MQPPTPDPNWFYSTIAQCSAAIVGVAGGFLFSWLLSRRLELAAEREPLVERLNGLLLAQDQLRKEAEHCKKTVERVLESVCKLRARGVAHADIEIAPFALLSHIACPVAHPSVAELRLLEDIPAVYEELRIVTSASRWDIARALMRDDPFPGVRAGLYQDSLTRNGPFDDDGIGPWNFWSGLGRQREVCIWKWRSIERQFIDLSHRVSAFRDLAVPPSISLAIGIIFGLVVSGLIVPLLFLTARPDPSKLILLSVFAVFVLGFVCYLGFEVRKLKRAADLSLPGV